MWRVWTLRVWEPGLAQESNWETMGINVGEGGCFHNKHGGLPITRRDCEYFKELWMLFLWGRGKIIPIALKPYGFKAIGKRTKCQGLFLLVLALGG